MWCWGLLCYRSELYQLTGTPPSFCFLFLFIHSFRKVLLGFGSKRNRETTFFVYALQICPLDFSTHGSYDPVVIQALVIHHRPQLQRTQDRDPGMALCSSLGPNVKSHHGPRDSTDHPGQCHLGGSEVLGHQRGLRRLTRPWVSTQSLVITGVIDMAAAG